MLAAVFQARIHDLVTQISGESSSGTVTGETPRADSAVWTVAKALRPLADLVAGGTSQEHIRARTGAQVAAGGAVMAG